MKATKNCLVRISSPVEDCNENSGDSIHIKWLMERFGLGISLEMFNEIFHKIAREFRVKPEPIKDLKFILSVETLNPKKEHFNRVTEEDIESDLINNKLKFCGCGDPQKVLDLIFKFIKLSQSHQESTPPSFQGKEWDAYCEKHRQEKRKLIADNADSVIWLIYYILDQKGIFIHGGNVSGGWLDDHEFFDLLTVWELHQKDEH